MATVKITTPTAVHASTPANSSAHAPDPMSAHAPIVHVPLPISIVHVPPPSFDWIAAIGTLAAIVLAYYTARLWRVTGNLVRDTETSSERQLRAYVGIDSIILDRAYLEQEVPAFIIPGKGFRPKLDVKMKNFGSTPANHVDLTASWSNGKPPENSKLDEMLGAQSKKIYESGFSPKHSIFPGQSAPIDVFIDDLSPFREALAGKRDAFVFGRIDYVDMFGERHATRFCYYYHTAKQPGDEFVPFERYNEAT